MVQKQIQNLPEHFNESLASTLSALIWHLDKKKILSFKDKIRLNNILKQFSIELVEKFIKGQQEHEGELIKKELDHEIDQELIDLVVYHSYSKLQRGVKI